MLFVKGTVEAIEHNSGTIPGKGGEPDFDWRTTHVEVGGERVKFRLNQDTGEYAVALPSEGDRVEIGVSIGLKQQRDDLLHPYLLVLQARSCTVVESAAEADAAAVARSLSSAPGKGARVPAQAAKAS